MTLQQWVDAVLRLIGDLTSWPVVTLAVAVVLRRRIIGTLATLSERTRRASVGPLSVEFDEVAIEALQDTARQAARELGADPTRLADFLAAQVAKFSEQSPASSEGVLTGSRVLWVDDNIRHNLFEMNYLQRLGADVDAATTTEQALRSLRTSEFHLVITDMHRVEDGVERPHAGLELLREISPAQRKALVVYTSNGSLWRENAEIAEHGAVVTDTASDLFAEVKRILRQRGPESGLRQFIPRQRRATRSIRP
jgi:CheY-like chemotaxis protein